MLNDYVSVTLKPRIYLLKSWERCYRCKNVSDVFCIAADGVIDHETKSNYTMFFRFSMISNAPENLLKLLKEKAPTYYLDFTKQSNSSYLVNHCKCGAKLGDFYLHEPGASFYPMSQNEAKDIVLQELKIDEEVKFDASYISDDTNFIPKFAKRI